MLTHDELATVTTLLTGAASGQPSPRQFVAAGLPVRLRGRLAEGPPYALVDTALTLCRDDAYRDDPPSMVALLSTLLPGQPEITAIVARIGTPPPEVGDPFEAVVMVSKLPFLDRPATRAALSRFHDPTPAQPVVVVNGPPRHGKTYTGEFIDHVLHGHRRVRHCRVEVAPAQGRSVGPAELARDLVTCMGGRPRDLPRPSTNRDRWAQELANTVISVANGSARDWWIVLDGFNTAELRPDTQQFIVKLAKCLVTGIARERHRLVLVDYERALLTLQPGLVAVDTAAPIPHAVVSVAVATIARPFPGVDPAALAARVLAGLADPVADLPELGDRLGALILSLEHAALVGVTRG